MIHIEDIHSLSDFQRNTKRHVGHLKETGNPEVLTVNGKAELVVQDATAYQNMLDEIDRLQAIVGIKAGLEEMRMGKGIPAQEAFDKLSQKNGLNS
jgi:hypothetical protein